jgi:hypothetical protein
MSKKRRTFSAEFKAKVGLEALRGVEPVHCDCAAAPGASGAGERVEEGGADASIYPIVEVVKLVDTLQLGRPSAAQFETALHHPLPIIRYWGVITAINADPFPDLRNPLDDADPTLRLAAAEAVIRRQAAGRETAWVVVEHTLTNGAPLALRLAAANVVADTADAPAPAINGLRALADITDAGFGPYSFKPFGALLKDRELLFSPHTVDQ